MVGDWLESSRYSIVQSEVKLEPIVTHVHMFSRALRLFAKSFDWFTGLSLFFVIGQNDDRLHGTKMKTASFLSTA